MFKYLFIHACNALSKDGNLRTRESVSFSAITLLSAGTLCWLGIIFSLFWFYILNRPLPKMPGSITLFLLSFGPFYYRFIINGKYKAIFEESKNESRGKNKTGKLITFLYIFTPMFLFMLVALIIHKRI